jgi:hypothetical protein
VLRSRGVGSLAGSQPHGFKAPQLHPHWLEGSSPQAPLPQARDAPDTLYVIPFMLHFIYVTLLFCHIPLMLHSSSVISHSCHILSMPFYVAYCIRDKASEPRTPAALPLTHPINLVCLSNTHVISYSCCIICTVSESWTPAARPPTAPRPPARRGPTARPRRPPRPPRPPMTRRAGPAGRGGGGRGGGSGRGAAT